jgi:hypothetical protein
MGTKNYYTVAGAVAYRKSKNKPTTFPTISKSVEAGTLPSDATFQVIDGSGKPIRIIAQEALDNWQPRQRQASSAKIEAMVKLGLTEEQARKVYEQVVKQRPKSK